MAKKSDNFYYQNFIDAASYSCKAAEYLVECLETYDPAKIKLMLEKMHDYEHCGDKKKHEMSVALTKAFITPIDREDLAELSQKIDEVTDTVEDVLQRFYIDQIQFVMPETIEFAKRIYICCDLMKKLMSELENFKKSEHIRKLIVELNNAEEECDRFYLDAAMNIRNKCSNVLDVVAWREIYAYMEQCADACEHVADSIETIVMKNT